MQILFKSINQLADEEHHNGHTESIEFTKNSLEAEHWRSKRVHVNRIFVFTLVCGILLAVLPLGMIIRSYDFGVSFCVSCVKCPSCPQAEVYPSLIKTGSIMTSAETIEKVGLVHLLEANETQYSRNPLGKRGLVGDQDVKIQEPQDEPVSQSRTNAGELETAKNQDQIAAKTSMNMNTFSEVGRSEFEQGSAVRQNQKVPASKFVDWEITPDVVQVPRVYRSIVTPTTGTDIVRWDEPQTSWPEWALPLETARDLSFKPSNAFGYPRDDSKSPWQSEVGFSEDISFATVSNACMVQDYRGFYMIMFRMNGKVYQYQIPATSDNCDFWKDGFCAYEFKRAMKIPLTLTQTARRIPGITALIGMNPSDYNLWHDWFNWAEKALEAISLQNKTIRQSFPVNVSLARHAVSLGECYKNRTTMVERKWTVRNDYSEMRRAGIRVVQGVPSTDISRIMREILPSHIPIILPECDLGPIEYETICFDQLVVPARDGFVRLKPANKRIARVLGPFRDISFRLYGITPPKSFCERVFGRKSFIISVYGRENQFRNIENAADVARWIQTSEEIASMFPGLKIEVRRITEPMTGPRHDAKYWADTDVMITPHGAAHVNAIYMPKDSVIIDVNPGCQFSTNKTSSPGSGFMGPLRIRTWGVFACMDHYITHTISTTDHYNCNDLRRANVPCTFTLTYDNVVYILRKVSSKLFEDLQQMLPKDPVLHGCSSAGVACLPFYDTWCPR